MTVFYVSQSATILAVIFFIQSVYIGWIVSAYAFEIFWNIVLFIHSIAYFFHYVVYWRITEKTGYSDAQLSGSITSFREMYGYRISGIIDRCTVLVSLALMCITGNVYGRDYTFYAYLFPSFILVLQISNFQSDYRNAIPISKCVWCGDLYMRKSQEAFEKAIRHDAQDKLEEEMKQKQRQEAEQKISLEKVKPLNLLATVRESATMETVIESETKTEIAAPPQSHSVQTSIEMEAQQQTTAGMDDELWKLRLLLINY